MSYTETTTQSWFSRIGDSLKGILVGFVLVGVAIALLFWNEGRTVKRYRALKQGASECVEIKSDAVDAANDGKLVYTTGTMKTDDVLADTDFPSVSVNALKLKRNVEMFQWKEESRSETVKKLGGGTETKTTYTYSTGWSSTPIDSSSFKESAGHTNPPMPYEGTEYYAENVTLGDFQVEPEVARQKSNWKKFSVPAPEAAPAPAAVPAEAAPAPAAVPVEAAPAPAAVPVEAVPAPAAVPVEAVPAPAAVPVETVPAPAAVPVEAAPAPAAVPVEAAPAPAAVPVEAAPAPAAVPVEAVPSTSMTSTVPAPTAQPAAVQPVMVQPAAQPAAVQPVMVQPAAQPAAVQPVMVQPAAQPGTTPVYVAQPGTAQVYAVPANGMVQQAVPAGPQVVNGIFYIGADPNHPQIGDVRISFEYVENGDVSVIAGQKDGKLIPFQINRNSIERVEVGTTTMEAMFENAQAENSMFGWILRAVGFFLMFIGFGMIFKPLSVLADVIPFLGSLVGGATNIVAGLLAGAISLITIAIAWLWFRPLIAIPLLLVAGALIFCAFKNGKKNA